MKKFLAILLTMVLCLSMLTACGRDYGAEESTVFVQKNGKIVCTDIESFDTSVYSEDEFRDYVDSQINSFNAQNGKDSVSLISLEITDNVATLELQYADCTAFSAFTGIDLFVGSVAEALASGYTFDQTFVSVDGDDYKDCSKSDLISATDYKIAVINSAYRVHVYGTIGYLSTDHISLVDKSTVSFRLGNSLSAAYADTEAAEAAEQVTESTEAVEVTEDTQAASQSEQTVEGGSVDDDEWVIGTEAEEEVPVFEFDQTQNDTENTVTESIGYAYILFK